MCPQLLPICSVEFLGRTDYDRVITRFLSFMLWSMRFFVTIVVSQSRLRYRNLQVLLLTLLIVSICQRLAHEVSYHLLNIQVPLLRFTLALHADSLLLMMKVGVRAVLPYSSRVWNSALGHRLALKILVALQHALLLLITLQLVLESKINLLGDWDNRATGGNRTYLVFVVAFWLFLCYCVTPFVVFDCCVAWLTWSRCGLLGPGHCERGAGPCFLKEDSVTLQQIGLVYQHQTLLVVETLLVIKMFGGAGLRSGCGLRWRDSRLVIVKDVVSVNIRLYLVLCKGLLPFFPTWRGLNCYNMRLN